MIIWGQRAWNSWEERFLFFENSIIPMWLSLKVWLHQECLVASTWFLSTWSTISQASLAMAPISPPAKAANSLSHRSFSNPPTHILTRSSREFCLNYIFQVKMLRTIGWIWAIYLDLGVFLLKFVIRCWLFYAFFFAISVNRVLSFYGRVCLLVFVLVIFDVLAWAFLVLGPISRVFRCLIFCFCVHNLWIFYHDVKSYIVFGMLIQWNFLFHMTPKNVDSHRSCSLQSI